MLYYLCIFAIKYAVLSGNTGRKVEAMRTREDLIIRQSLPLDVKIMLSRERVRQWVNEFGESGVYISFSGGKDSTVLLDLIRNVYGFKNIPAVFVDVPTQYPELKNFDENFENVTILKPQVSFMEVCKKYGFPLISKEVAHKIHDMNVSHAKGKHSYADDQFAGTYISKKGKTCYNWTKYNFLTEAPFKISHKCCDVMKKQPLHKYMKENGRFPITAQMTCESALRAFHWVKNGCNLYSGKSPISNPLSFWTEQDILQYIKMRNLSICSVYGDIIETEAGLKCSGCQRTGCMLCGFGCHLEKTPNRFEMLKETHPKMYNLLDVISNNGYTFRQAIDWLNEHGNLNIKY